MFNWETKEASQCDVAEKKKALKMVEYWENDFSYLQG